MVSDESIPLVCSSCGRWWDVRDGGDDCFVLTINYDGQVPDWVKQYPPSFVEVSSTSLICPYCMGILVVNQLESIEIPDAFIQE